MKARLWECTLKHLWCASLWSFRGQNIFVRNGTKQCPTSATIFKYLPHPSYRPENQTYPGVTNPYERLMTNAQLTRWRGRTVIVIIAHPSASNVKLKWTSQSVNQQMLTWLSTRTYSTQNQKVQCTFSSTNAVLLHKFAWIYSAFLNNCATFALSGASEFRSDYTSLQRFKKQIQ